MIPLQFTEKQLDYELMDPPLLHSPYPLIFYQTGLIEIIIPASIEIMSDGCFSIGKTLSSLPFETESILS
jgi:hypothetical protein